MTGLAAILWPTLHGTLAIVLAAKCTTNEAASQTLKLVTEVLELLTLTPR